MFIGKIKLENILSFKDAELELRPLNVLIGANASGKSNLIRAFDLIRSLPKDMQEKIADGGGPTAWINRRTGSPARIELLDLDGIGPSYSIVFRAVGQSYEIVTEDVPGLFHRRLDDVKFEARTRKEYLMFGALLHQAVLARFDSVIKQWGVPNHPVGPLANALRGIRLYREFKTGPGTQARQGINASAIADSLSEDGSNLALVLNEINHRSGLRRVNEALQRFCDLFEEVRILTRGGSAQVYVKEKDVTEPFAATSLSDGTLRLLCLLAILLDPSPPLLICIEEPEIGMHPDAIQMAADLLVEASSRTQLIVTTHSPALLDALTGQPESVVVCERDFDGFTTFKRLNQSDLDTWLEDYSLGELWTKGEIGGNRW